MRKYTTLAAATLGLAMAAGLSLPAAAQTVADEAQCNDAKASGDQNDIRQFCPVADWPQTVEPEVQTWIMGQSVPDVAYEGEIAVGTALPETVQLIEVPDHTSYRWAYLNGKRVLVVPDTRTVIAVY
jgi:hypothetical protein